MFGAKADAILVKCQAQHRERTQLVAHYFLDCTEFLQSVKFTVLIWLFIRRVHTACGYLCKHATPSNVQNTEQAELSWVEWMDDSVRFHESCPGTPVVKSLQIVYFPSPQSSQRGWISDQRVDFTCIICAYDLPGCFSRETPPEQTQA